MRKLLIGLISLAIVLAVYLLYNRLSRTPPIDISPGAEFVEAVADSNIGVLEDEVGKIGDVGVGPVQKAKYVILNEDKEIEREFGFEVLLHEVRDIWEIQKPYMNVYRHDFRCYITADRGRVQIETAVGKTTPKDATFTGNVVVRILPGESSDLKEGVVYLDEVIFLSERSQLSTGGPVRFVSEDAEMTGTGMEIVYNDQADRLEYFRIIDLERLHMRARMSQGTFLSSEAEQAGSPLGETQAQQTAEHAVAGDSQEAETSVATTSPQVEQEKGQYYKCILSKNVVIDTPDQLVFAVDEICINDIFWSKASSSSSGELDAGEDETKDVTDDVAGTVPGSDDAGMRKVTDSQPSEPNKPREELMDIIVTCDNGVVILPMDSPRALNSSARGVPAAAAADGRRPDVLDDGTERTKFFTQRIDYDARGGDAVASGFSELTFYAAPIFQTQSEAESNMNSGPVSEPDEVPVPVKVTARQGAKFFQAPNQLILEGDCLCIMPQLGLAEQQNATFSAPKITVSAPEYKSQGRDILAAGPATLTFHAQPILQRNHVIAAHVDIPTIAETESTALPVTATAQKQVRFIAASNQVIFEGDCQCTMVREDPNVLVKYMLSAEQITMDFPEDAERRASESTRDIERLTADGGAVKLSTINKAGEEMLGGVELECREFEYDGNEQLFVATGPGVINFYNSRVSDSNEPDGRFSLRRPCWAFLRDFDTVTYLVPTNQIIADGGSRRLLIDYFPAVDGQYDKYFEAIASRLEAQLTETPDGQTELSTLLASGGIDYEDDDNLFVGSELFYDHERSVIEVNGNASQPCYLNGALVDAIEYDLKTRRVKAEIIGPGALRTNR